MYAKMRKLQTEMKSMVDLKKKKKKPQKNLKEKILNKRSRNSKMICRKPLENNGQEMVYEEQQTRKLWNEFKRK